MNSTRFVIGFVALLMIVSAGAIALSDSNNTDAAVVDSDNIRYNSDLGFEVTVSDVSGGAIIRIESTSGTAGSGIGPWAGGFETDGTRWISSMTEEISNTGTFGFSILDDYSGEVLVQRDSIYILGLVFDSNNEDGETVEKYLSEGYTGYVLSNGFGWTDGDQSIIGWSTTPDGDVEYELGSELPTFTRDMTSRNTLTLYAVYGTISSVTVTFDSNGGSAVDSITVKAGQSIETSPITTRDGYIFDGWFTENGIEVEFPYTVNGDVTLYAHWIAQHTVTFHADGEVFDTVIVSDGERVGEPSTNPSKEGYTFAGWFTDEGLTQAYDFETPVTGDLDLYAKFNPIEQPVYHTVTYGRPEHIASISVTDADGNTIKNGQQVLEGTVINVTVVPEDGYQVYRESYTLRVTDDVVIAPMAVAEIDVTVVPGEHGAASLGSLVLTSDNTWTATVVIDEDRGYRAKVAFAPEGTYEYEIDRNGNVVIYGLTADLRVDVTFEQIPVSDDDEEYVPPVITVIPGDDDDSTTYIVAIAAGVVVAILAALILMQTRKS